MTKKRISALALTKVTSVMLLALILGGCDFRTTPHTVISPTVGSRQLAPTPRQMRSEHREPTGTAPDTITATASCVQEDTPVPDATPWATPNAPLKTSTGRAMKVERLANGQVHLVLVPDVSSMQADFTIADWSRVTVLNYWVGFQTPTAVASDEQAAVVQAALSHEVTIGYYNTIPPLVVMVSVHKQEGDPQ